MRQWLRGLVRPGTPHKLSERTRRWFAAVWTPWLLLAAALTWMALSIYSSGGDLITYFSSILTVEYSHRFYAYLLDYPPGWVETSSLLGWGYSAFFPASTILQQPGLPSPAFVLVEKSLLFAADLLAGLAIYRLVLERSGDTGWAKLSLASWLFNPLVLFTSAVHGAYDVIPAAFSVMAFYLAIHSRFLSAGAALGLGIWFKIFPVFFLPVLLVVIWQVVNRRPWDFLKGVGLGASGLGLVTAAVLWPPGLLQASLSSIPSGLGESFGGFGLWSFLSLGQFESLRLWLYNDMSQVLDVLYAVVSALVVLFAWRLYRNKSAEPNSPATHHALLASAIVAPSVAATVHPQYILWGMPFLALILWERREYLIPYAGIGTAIVLYQLLGHGGPLYWFQALAVDTRLVTPAALFQSFSYWGPRATEMLPWFEIPVFIVLVLTLIHSFQLIRPVGHA